MNHHQLSELQHAITTIDTALQADPDSAFGVLRDVACKISSPIWRMRMYTGPVQLGYGEPTSAHLTQMYLESEIELDIDGLDQRLDDHAFELEWALMLIHANEIAQVRRVLFMLRTWVKNEANLNPAPPAKPKRYRYKDTRDKPKQKSAWSGAKSLAKQSAFPYKNKYYGSPIEPQKCLLVTNQGVMACSLNTLLFVQGECDKQPGVYNAKTGESVDEPNTLQKWHDGLLRNPNDRVWFEVTFDAQDLLNNLQFVAALGGLRCTLSTSDKGVFITSTSEQGDACVPLTHTPLPDHSGRYALQEIVKCVKLMVGTITLTVYHMGNIRLTGGNAEAYTLMEIKGEE